MLKPLNKSAMPEHVRLKFFIGLFTVMGILLINGRMLNLINMPEKRREKYDGGRLGKFIGISMFVYAAAFALILAGEYRYPYHPLEICGIVLICSVSVFLIVNIFTGNRYINKR